MTAVVTDVHYRMAAALIRDLGEAGITVTACERVQYPAALGFASRYVSRREILPEEGYGEALFALCREMAENNGEKPVLLPVGAVTLALLAKERARFETVCALLVPTEEQLRCFNDKAWLARFAAGLGIAVPESYERNGQTPTAFFTSIHYPCVVKPICGEKFGLHAEKRYQIVKTAEECQNAYEHFAAITGEAPVVQEYLPGGGMGCSVLAKNGDVLAHICHRRLREYPVTGGPSSCCETVDAPELVQMVKTLVRETGYSGVAMFEFKLDAAGKAYLLECNPRVWGTYPLTRLSRSNFAELWYHAAQGGELPAYRAPERCKMAFYPSDLAAALGYLKRGNVRACFAAARDVFSPQVKNGLAERDDPGPGRAYWKSLLKGKLG